MTDTPIEPPSLKVLGGPLDGYELKLSFGMTAIVGSGRLANLRLDSPDIEMAHVKVRWDEIGLSMVDNGSRKGTWLNGEPIETAALLDGDMLEFTGPGTKSTAPRVRVTVPKGSVLELPPVEPPVEPAASTAAAPLAKPQPLARPSARPRAAGAARGRAARTSVALPWLAWLKWLAVAGVALLALAALGWGASRLLFSSPQIESIEPREAEPGQVLRIRGKRFGRGASQNLVWFGSLQAPAESAAGDTVQVRVPALSSGAVAVQVECDRRRSGRVELMVVTPLRALALDPVGALPGDEVLLAGEGFNQDARLTVGGVTAKVLGAEPRVLKFVVPQLTAAVGSPLAVVVSVGARSAPAVALVFGRVPFVTAFDPAQGVVGDLVRIRGAGFASDPEANAVTVDGSAALVADASSLELTVVLPPATRPAPLIQAPVVIRALGRTSQPFAYPVLRLVEGAWVPRFVATPVEGVRGQASVGTEIAPTLLLASRDGSRSVAARAVRVAALLNEAVDRARAGQKIVFEPREQPAGVALAGALDLTLRVTNEDAAAYTSPAGLPARAVAPDPKEVARLWAALLTDYVAIGTSPAAPSASVRVSPEAGAALSQLRATLPWQYGTGVPSARVVSLPEPLRRRLRDAAFRIP
jgi:hypothetical protein